MPVPKKRTSRTKKKLRRSHEALTKASLVTCSQCGEPKALHRICANCGTYKGKRYLETEG